MAKTVFDNNPSDTNPYSDLPELMWVVHKLWPGLDVPSVLRGLMCENGEPKWVDHYRRRVVDALSADT